MSMSLTLKLQTSKTDKKSQNRTIILWMITQLSILLATSWFSLMGKSCTLQYNHLCEIWNIIGMSIYLILVLWVYQYVLKLNQTNREIMAENAKKARGLVRILISLLTAPFIISIIHFIGAIKVMNLNLTAEAGFDNIFTWKTGLNGCFTVLTFYGLISLLKLLRKK